MNSGSIFSKDKVHYYGIKVAVINLFLAAFAGALLRYHFVNSFDWLEYKKFLHGHSHVAMLGWVHLAFYLLFHRLYVPRYLWNKKAYFYIFGLSQLMVIGCLVLFPVYGYNVFTMTITSIHVLLTYWFAYRFFKDTRNDGRTSLKWARIAVIWILFATVSVWFLPVIISIYGRSSEPYLSAVQFYLHFRFNGWQLFSVLAFLCWWFEMKGMPQRIFRNPYFIGVLVVSVFLVFGYNLYWIFQDNLYYVAYAPGGLLELAAFVWLLTALYKPARRLLSGITLNGRLLIYTALISLLVRSTMQAALLIPEIADTVIHLRHLFVAFMHIIFLGVVSPVIMFTVAESGLFNLRSKLFSVGTALFLIGYLTTEIILNSQGVMFWLSMGFMPHFHLVIFIAAVFLLLGAGCWVLLRLNS